MHFSVDSKTAGAIKAGGKYLKSGIVSIRFLPDLSYRYSPVVSKKQGTSVRRNRIKRVIREIMRAGKDCFPSGSYMIYYNGKSADRIDPVEFQDAIEMVIQRIPETCGSRSIPAELSRTQDRS